jgi:hypothetical protein
MFHHRSEKFPGRFDDRGTENELAVQRLVICERVRRAAAEALSELRARQRREGKRYGRGNSGNKQPRLSGTGSTICR